MLGLNQLEIRVENRVLFAAGDIRFDKGLIALVGRNGAGKSTFLRTIMGGHGNYSGTVSLNGKTLQNYSRLELAKKIAMVYSKTALFGKHTGRQVIALGRLPYQNMFAQTTAEDQNKIEEIVQLLNIEHFVDRSFSNLSDGERQLIMIGRAMAQKTPIILLDEPGAFLDLVNKHKLMNVLREITEKTDRLILFSTHEVGFLEEFCSKVLLIGNGEMKVLEDRKTYVSTIYDSFGIEKKKKNEV